MSSLSPSVGESQTRGHRFKRGERFEWDQRVVHIWNVLPEATMEESTITMFKNMRGKIWRKMEQIQANGTSSVNNLVNIDKLS